MSYADLTETEKAYYDIYARYRQLSDWEGFTDYDSQIKADTRAWLEEKRKEIWRCAEGKDPGCKPGWGINQRSSRYETLKDDSLNSSEPHNLCQLPTNGGTPSEKCMISVRELWWNLSSVNDETKAWRQYNADELTAQRKKLWNLAEDENDWESADRSLRYDNLCIATKTGQAFEEWSKGHNDHTGEPVSSSGKSARSKCKDWLDSYVGVHENPDGSNKGSPQPSKWQQRVYGDDGVPWCACFAVCSAWDQNVKGSGTAGVYNNVQLAKSGQGIYRGWTNDPSKVHAGDHAFIGSDHTGVIYDREKGTTVEGNTSSSGGGSQWNGGQVAKKTRGWSYWSAGFGIVDFDE